MLLLIISVMVHLSSQIDTLEEVLVDMQEHYLKETGFDEKFYYELIDCFGKDGDHMLFNSQKNVWRGISDYWISNGNNTDYLGEPDNWGNQQSPFYER